jgi:hypothetical protein
MLSAAAAPTLVRSIGGNQAKSACHLLRRVRIAEFLKDRATSAITLRVID